jgi:hypothetical protein
MTINDLLNGFRRTLVHSALGLALLAPAGYGCGDDVTNNYFGDEGKGSSGYTCEDACAKISECDWIDPNIDDYYGHCLDECYRDEWSDMAIVCTMDNSCDNWDALCEKYVP